MNQKDEVGLRAIAVAIRVLAYQVGKIGSGGGSDAAVLQRIEAKIDTLLERVTGSPEDQAKLDALGKRIDAQTQELDDTVKNTNP